MIPPISKPVAEILRKSTFICANDISVNIPAGIEVSPATQAEIEGLLRAFKISVREAATASLAALLEMHGVMPSEEPPALH